MTLVPLLARTAAERLSHIPGVVAVSLGGSHAAGSASPDSDIDLGLYYDAAQPFDLAALNLLCRELDDTHAAEASEPGGWGPWVNGGAWLTISGQRLDLIYRELGRVQTSVEDALAGRVSLHAQVGHPHGIHGHHYAAELAVSAPLHDPTGRLAALRQRVQTYPEALRRALLTHYSWQAGFWLDGGAKGQRRGDVHYAQGCSYQAVMAMVQALCAQAGVWLLNEKGAARRAGETPQAPPDFEARAQSALTTLDLDALMQLNREVEAVVGP